VALDVVDLAAMSLLLLPMGVLCALMARRYERQGWIYHRGTTITRQDSPRLFRAWIVIAWACALACVVPVVGLWLGRALGANA
jgi:ABC-type Fe3+ transport system permease subunit